MKKHLLIISLFLFIIKVSGASYTISFREKNIDVPLYANIMDYMPVAIVRYNNTKIDDESIYYEYGLDGTSISVIDTSKVKTYRLVIRATSENLDIYVKESIYFSIVDSEPPRIFGASNRTIVEDTAFDLLENVGATDNYDQEIEVSTIGTIDNSVIGDYQITYVAIDSSGNQTTKDVIITITDITPPSLEVDDIIIGLNSDFKITDYATSHDKYRTTISYEGLLDIYKTGDYVISVVASDSSFNETTKDITVMVVDNIKPTIKIKESMILINDEKDIRENIIEVSDNYDDLKIEDVTINYKMALEGCFLITYSITDSSGNKETMEAIGEFANSNYLFFQLDENINMSDFDLLKYIKAFYGKIDISERISILETNYNGNNSTSFYCIYEVYSLNGEYLREKITYNDKKVEHVLPVFPDEIKEEEKKEITVKKKKTNPLPYIIIGLIVFCFVGAKIFLYFFKKRAIIKK